LNVGKPFAPKSYSENSSVIQEFKSSPEEAHVASDMRDGSLSAVIEKSIADPKPAATLKQVRKAKAPFSELPKEERWNLAVELMAKVPNQSVVWVAREYNLPIDELLAHAKAH
jgi:hypothetical protein